MLGHLVLQTSVATSLQEVFLGIKLALDGRISLWKMGCDMETSSTETLPKNEVKEVGPSVGNSNIKETTPVAMGHVAIS